MVTSGITKILDIKNLDSGVAEILKIGSNWYACVIDFLIYISIRMFCSYAGGIDGKEYKKMKWSFNMMLIIVIYEATFKKVIINLLIMKG